MKRTKHFVMAAFLGTGLAGSGALLSGANAVTVCTPTPQSLAAACAGADPSVGIVSVDSAESATIWVGGSPTPTCIGRVTVNALSPTPVTYDPRLVYRCYP
jgi:hypothetical protein